MIDKVKKTGLPVGAARLFYVFSLWLLFLFLVAEKETVILGELAYEQASVDGCDAVGDERGYPLSLAAVFLRRKKTVLQRGELAVVLAYLRKKLCLALLNLVQRVVLLLGCLNGQVDLHNKKDVRDRLVQFKMRLTKKWTRGRSTHDLRL